MKKNTLFLFKLFLSELTDGIRILEEFRNNSDAILILQSEFIKKPQKNSNGIPIQRTASAIDLHDLALKLLTKDMNVHGIV